MPYKSTKKENGKYAIEKVPVFQLGNFRDFEYSLDWADLMLLRMKQRQENGYYAPVIIGHNGFGSELKEKEVIGFMNNFSVEAMAPNTDGMIGTIYCDIDDVPESAIGDIVDMKYPYRSVEVRSSSAEFTALALLGGTEPYFKFPRMEIYAAGAPGEAFTFADTEGTISMCDVSEDQDGSMKSLFAMFLSEIKRMFKQPAAESVATINPTNTDGGRADMNNEEYLAKYGMTPEEAADRAVAADTYKAEIARLTKDKFASEMKVMGVCPAGIELMMDETKPKEEIFRELVSMQKENKLLVPLDETAGFAEKTVTADPSADDNEIFEMIKAYSAKHGVDFETAKKAVFAAIDAAKGGK